MKDPAFLVHGKIVRRGFLRPKQVEITITDGLNKWSFITSSSFTIPELKQRFPFFLKKRSDT